MRQGPRYAVYYAPPANSALWEKGSEWLGRDAYTGQKKYRSSALAKKLPELDQITRAPAHYGFHATMKAPFELRSGATEQELLAFLDEFSLSQDPFAVQLELRSLGQFLALRLREGAEAMRALHVACVKDFDQFRAPLSDEDIERRRKAKLTKEQDDRMLKWGYPYIFDDFRWHMTLSNKVPSESTRAKIMDVLSSCFSEILEEAHEVDGMAIYKQEYRDAPFNIIKRSAFPALTRSPA